MNSFRRLRLRLWVRLRLRSFYQIFYFFNVVI
jgi:hypothetical protein